MDLQRVLQQGKGSVPSTDDFAHMVRDESYIDQPAGYGNAIVAWHELTPGDKHLIQSSTGWDMFKDPYGRTASEEALAFAGRLNLDRYTDSHYGSGSGLNGGEVTQAYIGKLVQENFSRQPGQAVVPLAILYQVQAHVAAQAV